MVSTMAARSLTQAASCAIALQATATMETTSSSKVFMIVRADNVLYGQAACKYIGTHVKGSGHVAMLEGDLASINGLDRKNGFLKCMKAYPKLQVVEYATKWDTPTAVNRAPGSRTRTPRPRSTTPAGTRTCRLAAYSSRFIVAVLFSVTRPMRPE